MTPTRPTTDTSLTLADVGAVQEARCKSAGSSGTPPWEGEGEGLGVASGSKEGVSADAVNELPTNWDAPAPLDPGSRRPIVSERGIGGVATSSGGIDPSRGDDVHRIAAAVLTARDQRVDVASSSLPLPIREVINLFLVALDAKHPQETKELVVRALRVCSTSSCNAPDLGIPTLLPLLLDPSPSLRQHTANCLLQFAGNTSLPTLQLHLSRLASTLSRALSPSRPPPPRFVSTCLRILTTAISRLPPLPAEVVSTMLAIIGNWVFFRDGPALGASATPPDRERGKSAGAALAGGGALGGFMPPVGAGRKKGKEILSRSSSSASLKGVSSESEADDGEEKSKHTSMHVRLDALICLRALASNHPKALYSHWNLFLADSPYLRSRNTLLALVETDPAVAVRVRACQALEALLEGSTAYLAIAEDRPTKASFTSLSSKLGEVVSELHIKLAALLSSLTAATHPPQLLALLALAKTLGDTAPYGRIQRPLAPLLSNALLPLLSHPNEGIALAASCALTSVFKNVFSHPISLQIADAAGTAQTALDLLQLSKSAHLTAALWDLFAISYSGAPSFELSPALTLLQSTSPLASQILLVSILFRPTTSQIPLAPYAPTFLRITQLALASERADLRITACGVLASPLAAEVIGGGVDPLAEGVRAAGEADAGVRAAGCRLLGLLVKGPDFVADGANLGEISKGLVVRCGDPEPTKSTASWALANCCDTLSDSNASAIDSPGLINQALLLVVPSNGEKVQTNALRALGSLIKFPSAAVDAETVNLVVHALSDCVSTGPVKVRWNAAAASSNFFSGPRFSSPDSLSSHDSTRTISIAPLLDSLSAALLSSKNYKVRIQATAALTALPSREAFGTEFGKVRDTVRDARVAVGYGEGEGEEGKGVGSAEREHWRVLVAKLERCGRHLELLGRE